MSSAMTWAGDFAVAPATMPSPIGPQPATTTTSSNRDVGPLDRVQGAGQRLGEGGMGRRDVLA